MQIVELIFIWIIVGVWITYKRNWYIDSEDWDGDFICIINIVFAPLALIIAFFRIFIMGSWKK